MSFITICENKILSNISEFTVFVHQGCEGSGRSRPSVGPSAKQTCVRKAERKLYFYLQNSLIRQTFDDPSASNNTTPIVHKNIEHGL